MEPFGPEDFEPELELGPFQYQGLGHVLEALIDDVLAACRSDKATVPCGGRICSMTCKTL